MLRRVARPVVVLAMVAGAVYATADSMRIVNDAMCGTPRSFEACYQPVLVPALLGAGLLALLMLALFGVVARRRAPLVVLVGSAAVGVILASPVWVDTVAPDGCNRSTGYLPRVAEPAAQWLADHHVLASTGGYITLANCFEPPTPEDAALTAVYRGGVRLGPPGEPPPPPQRSNVGLPGPGPW